MNLCFHDYLWAPGSRFALVSEQAVTRLQSRNGSLCRGERKIDLERFQKMVDEIVSPGRTITGELALIGKLRCVQTLTSEIQEAALHNCWCSCVSEILIHKRRISCPSRPAGRCCNDGSDFVSSVYFIFLHRFSKGSKPEYGRKTQDEYSWSRLIS